MAWIYDLPKRKIDQLMLDFFIDPRLEVKKSQIHGLGCFVKQAVQSGDILDATILMRSHREDLRNYVWLDGLVIAGVGWFANGSCKTFQENISKDFFPFKPSKINCRYDIRLSKFVFTENLEAGDEVVLDYGDKWFFEMKNGIPCIDRIKTSHCQQMLA